MKKIIYLFLFTIMLIPITVNADEIYSINMKIDIQKDGTANVTENWEVKASNGTEWYKTMYELNNSELTNYQVYMDGKLLEYEENWNTNASRMEKAEHYGINYTNQGIELCFGKKDYQRHRFTLKYNLSNYIFNTNDSQVLAWILISQGTTNYFSAEISSYYQFPQTLEVWGTGYYGYSYVEDGKIKVSTENGLNQEYVSLLVKFPLNTFETENTYLEKYQTFDDVYNLFKEGTFEQDYDNEYNYVEKTSIFEKIMIFISSIMPFIIFGLIVVITIILNNKNKYGYINNKVIDKKNLPMFRDIPCNKDIYYANALIKLNNFNYKDTNIFGAIILKWVKNDKIIFSNSQTGFFNKDTSVIDLTKNPTFDNELEKRLFDMMYEASNDGILEAKELEKWSRKNYSEFLSLFKRIENETIDNLKSNNLIYKRTYKEECKYQNVMNDTIYNDSIQLYGLKKYLEEFSRMNTKEVMEVKLWDEYLMFAYLFGIADKVAKQLKDMYPEIMENPEMGNGFDYNTFVFINSISNKSVSAATSARAAAESYTSGGGGFSSGGGGGFSSGGFSGGGGGSFGGR